MPRFHDRGQDPVPTVPGEPDQLEVALRQYANLPLPDLAADFLQRTFAGSREMIDPKNAEEILRPWFPAGAGDGRVSKLSEARQ